MRLWGHELARHLMGWHVLAFRQKCSEICTAMRIGLLLAAKCSAVTLVSGDISFMN